MNSQSAAGQTSDLPRSRLNLRLIDGERVLRGTLLIGAGDPPKRCLESEQVHRPPASEHSRPQVRLQSAAVVASQSR
jgi:hypothetical protein